MEKIDYSTIILQVKSLYISMLNDRHTTTVEKIEEIIEDKNLELSGSKQEYQYIIYCTFEDNDTSWFSGLDKYSECYKLVRVIK